MLKSTDDLRITQLRELRTPEEVVREFPRTDAATRTVTLPLVGARLQLGEGPEGGGGGAGCNASARRCRPACVRAADRYW